jgi:uncharacterized protein
MENHHQTRVQELSRTEALELLQGHAYVGRLGFIIDGKPMILPVNYLADEASIVFCTEPGTKLSAVGGGSSVVFEVDDSRALYHSGWSVIVQGIAHEVTDPDELNALRRGPLHSWGAHASEHWVRISLDEISGRRIPGS